MINAGDKYQFDGTILIGFFENWFAANVNMGSMDADFARQLALPCYMFDHAKGFSDITKWLAYNFGGHITENRPAGFRWKHMHLSPPDFVGPMNHARGGLKTVLHRGIWNRVGKLLEQGPESNLCDEWDTVAGRYFAELVRIDAYPLETIFPKHSMNTILERLEKFKLGDIGDCFCCEIDWRHHITKSIENTRTNFHGLCIDCMDSSKPKRGSTDEDYWMHLGTVGGRWDTHCRVKHGQQTWYVSWLGRSEHRQKLLNKANEIRAEIRARLPY
ncbi:hypothetical protein P280DRAFT_414639 [Massarina eburnea CBS 473.64]|uniref:Uncharacterized protein n=1 Tax=Massarina eburnea CBS 473.64 TaxID=1395130 RepID=A0A6A6RG88_9PLEO|nr:hypothetical protein P280DRAFT_414639 [Massarina eburnea CBS 473.64]